jgi:hypothetical protein
MVGASFQELVMRHDSVRGTRRQHLVNSLGF